MATFTVDLLTGDVYLFTGDFTGSGSTPTSGSTYPEVNLFSELPSPSTNAGKIYVVRTGSGSYVLNRKDAGLYFSNGLVWRRLGDTPSYFLSNNTQIIDSTDQSKGIMFDVSGISTNTFRKLKIQDKDGVVAYLTDLDAKVDITAFADYTGTTAPNTFVDWVTYSGYTGTTLSLINTKQNTLIAGNNISIVGDIISVTGITALNTLQLSDVIGSQNVNNIPATPINWTTEIFSGTSLNYTGGSRIYIESKGVYDVSYLLNVNNTTGSGKNIGTLIRKNGNTDVTLMSSASVNLDIKNDSSTNIMPNYKISLNNDDYIELVGFRIGTSGNVFTVANGSWIRVLKIK